MIAPEPKWDETEWQKIMVCDQFFRYFWSWHFPAFDLAKGRDVYYCNTWYNMCYSHVFTERKHIDTMPL